MMIDCKDEREWRKGRFPVREKKMLGKKGFVCVVYYVALSSLGWNDVLL